MTDAVAVETGDGTDSLATWQPTPGPLTEGLIDRQNLDPQSKERLIASAVRTLGRCGSPEVQADRSSAHLVVGEVQSGKTLAFTTLMALARDNGFRLIIVIAGTKRNLLEQTVDRLNEDLLHGTGGLNPWRVWKDPAAGRAGDIESVVSQPRDPAAAVDGTQTAVCFVLKQGSRLKGLRRALDAIGEPVLRAVPTLVIDDEADQASLNLRDQQGERSSVYDAIAEMRTALPRHDFLMYTATPQGPLLVKLGDEISPETVTVLESGPGYVGGLELFVEGRSSYVRSIPDAELEAALNPESDSPPASLRRAVATFLLALVIAQGRDKPKPLTMLIHPATANDLHDLYARWAKAIRDELIAKLDDPEDAAFTDTLNADLRAPYEDLAATVEGIPDLTKLAQEVPIFARQLEIRQVNQNAPSELRQEEWLNFPGWIVVGGNKLERGFTIQNLAITYMPRGPGVGNADTIQQRGRFFGYKRAYADLCRGWFSAQVADVFADYVEHEEAMHEALREVDSSSRPLRMWRRELILSPSMRPTRRQVMTLSTTRQSITSRDGWFRQSHLFDPAAAKSNLLLAESLFRDHRQQAAVDPRDSRKRHVSVRVRVAEIHELLADWEAARSDDDRLLGVSIVLSRLLEDQPPAECLLVFMDGVRSVDDLDNRRVRRREQREGPSMTVNIFQGSDARTGYTGDSDVYDPKLPTLQLHLLDLLDRDRTPLVTGVPAIAVHLPTAVTTLILQD